MIRFAGMKVVKVDLRNDDEKKAIMAFLDRLNYRYAIENDEQLLPEADIQEVIQRKKDFLDGKITSRPWSQIKQSYES